MTKEIGHGSITKAGCIAGRIQFEGKQLKLWLTKRGLRTRNSI